MHFTLGPDGLDASLFVARNRHLVAAKVSFLCSSAAGIGGQVQHHRARRGGRHGSRLHRLRGRQHRPGQCHQHRKEENRGFVHVCAVRYASAPMVSTPPLSLAGDIGELSPMPIDTRPPLPRIRSTKGRASHA